MSDTPMSGRPSLLKELARGSVGGWARAAITLALAATAAGAALLGGFFLAALNPDWDAYRGGFGIHPRDELMVTVSILAGVAFLVAAGWIWSRGRANRAVIYAAILSVAIVGATIGLCVVADSAVRGAAELVIAGVIFFGAAVLILTWVVALRRSGPRGRASRNAEDGLLDVLCPACGYRMVGLRESRCPECGAEYTLDELLTRQRFAPAAAVGPTLPPPVPPPSANLPPVPSPAVARSD
jgi:hypothetical protein